MQTAPAASLKPYLLSVEEYEKAYFAGAYHRVRVELINGQVVESPKMTDAHFNAYVALHDGLMLALREVASVACRCPVKIFEHNSEPDPDFTVVANEQYKSRVPQASEVALLVEISETPWLEQSIHMPLYAKARVPEFWLVNLVTKELEVYTDPQSDEYLTRRAFKPQEAVASKAFPDKPIEWW